MPGRKENNGETSAVDNVAFRKSFLASFISFNGVIDCSLGKVLFLRLIIKPEMPNSPVRRGIKEFSIGRLNVKNPRRPERTKIIAEIVIFFSLSMIKREMKIKINGMIVFIRL